MLRQPNNAIPGGTIDLTQGAAATVAPSPAASPATSPAAVAASPSPAVSAPSPAADAAAVGPSPSTAGTPVTTSSTVGRPIGPAIYGRLDEPRQHASPLKCIDAQVRCACMLSVRPGLMHLAMVLSDCDSCSLCSQGQSYCLMKCVVCLRSVRSPWRVSPQHMRRVRHWLLTSTGDTICSGRSSRAQVQLCCTSPTRRRLQMASSAGASPRHLA